MKSGSFTRRWDSPSSVWVVVLLSAVLTAVMLLAGLGGALFRSVTDNRSANMNRRGTLSYVSARILAADETGVVHVEQGEDGSILTLGNGSVFYLEDGVLLEGKKAGDPEAEKIAQTSVFEVSLKDALLTVTTDEGCREIYLHSEAAYS